MISTVIDQSLGLEFPIFQGGMAWVADASLAAGVSNAGGLGIIAAMNSNGEQLREEIQKCKKMTDKIFGVNIMLMSPFADEVADVVIEEGIKVVTTGAGNPGKYMPKWKEAGIKVIPVVPSVALARKMEKDGAFAVIAEGGESGGHVGEITTMALVPQVVDAVSIPVIAAGGIADGRQIAAAFMLGAVGVQVGTRFLVAEECTISQEYKNKVLKARDIDTVVTGKRLGHPVRSLKNTFTREYAKAEYDKSSVSDEELEKMGAGVLRMAARGGDVSHGCVLAGQVAGMIKKEQPAREIIEEMFTQAEEVLNGATKWVK
ncbi:MAG: enoyl-[acyl-carrier-protein] reductase FabK [Ruminococcus bromii]|jgi:enoyl-[acyl-carrier protein] reductase II|uniref:enoyl-[acyl-carrier-protein] reductase FabK n=1 Tax=Ruminococcus sp. YE282 TaxID=3158780 RepID=UPI000883E564|nr:enoyl-[acyl-carrier-protein] reductase FabK [Ruminococcus bromii]MCI7211128.1 enoyl-[acyl-carrier-protein] reductase FabK [Ruminococcus bromii]MDD6433392.1 enoyl-[acyl-carrier-protein] reductase FabK [Ruminococcus bromii]MDY4085190.1 enoyl-[acyl-carrier-protein] reductase FabK [Ruminococcus bromii]MDY4711270.1 enoyl-[acyl-carrier-protein] reductase FabK [Ruminococcus bromii]